MIRKSVKQLYALESYDVAVEIRGWVRTRRGGKKFSFIELNDGSCAQNIQLVADNTRFDAELLKDITTGACIGVKGLLVQSSGQEQPIEVQVTDLVLYGAAEADTYPLQKKAHSLEFLREIGHLRPRTATFGAIFRLRASLAYAIHHYFYERGFFYVHTPIITGSDTEGAGEMFRVTTLPALNPPLNDAKEVDFTKDFFGKQTHLTVSGQLNGELAALGLGLIYTFGPTFRAENSNTTRHLAEFWMIEPEMAFYTLEDNMALAEDFLKYLIRFALERNADDLAFLAKTYDEGLFDRLNFVVNNDFIRLDYTDAIEILNSAISSGRKFEYPVTWGADLQSEHERYLVEEHFGKPVIVINYPKEIKAFYMRANEDGKTVRAMDVLFPGVGEIIGGSQREERLSVLMARISELGLKEEDYWWYLDTRRYGTAPHSGFGMGFERLLLFVSGMGNIRDVIPFPRTPGNAEF